MSCLLLTTQHQTASMYTLVTSPYTKLFFFALLLCMEICICGDGAREGSSQVRLGCMSSVSMCIPSDIKMCEPPYAGMCTDRDKGISTHMRSYCGPNRNDISQRVSGFQTHQQILHYNPKNIHKKLKMQPSIGIEVDKKQLVMSIPVWCPIDCRSIAS